MIKIKSRKNKSSFFVFNIIKTLLNTNPFSAETRQKIFVVILFILFALIIIKLVNLQIIQHSSKDQFVQSMVYKESEELQQRGFIFDRNKNILAMSIQIYTLSLDAKMIEDLKAIENILSKYDITLSSSNYKSIKDKKRYIPIKHNISEQTILSIKQDIKDERAKIRQKRKQLQKDLKLYKKDPEKKKSNTFGTTRIKKR